LQSKLSQELRSITHGKITSKNTSAAPPTVAAWLPQLSSIASSDLLYLKERNVLVKAMAIAGEGAHSTNGVAEASRNCLNKEHTAEPAALRTNKERAQLNSDRSFIREHIDVPRLPCGLRWVT
jgi:hypothetical protein